MPRGLWTQHELDLLEKMVERYPSFKCCKEYQKRAKQLGYPDRNDASIRHQVKVKFGGFRKITRLNNFTIRDLHEIFGIERNNFHNWIKEGKLHAERISKGLFMVSATSMRKFAHQYPHTLSYVDRDRLMYFFNDDADFVNKILSLKKFKRGRRKKLLNKETGQVYDSVRDAAKSLHYSFGQMSKKVKKDPLWVFLSD